VTGRAGGRARRRAPASSMTGDVRAPSTPDRNLEKPYATGRMDVRPPTLARSMPMPGSLSMAGATYARLLRVR